MVNHGISHYKILMQLPSADILSLSEVMYVDVCDPFHYFELKSSLCILCYIVLFASHAGGPGSNLACSTKIFFAQFFFQFPKNPFK